MLAKLIHFEFKSTYKLFLILIGAEFLLSIVLGVSVNTNLKIMSERLAYDPFYTSNSSTVSFILVLMVVGIVFATFMMIFGSSVQRFHKNLLSGQGYLMHTLPVTTWQLVLAMSREAKVYFLDEPIGGVDPAARDYILRTIIGNYSENALVVISTHLIADVEPVLDEAIFIRDGEIVFHRTVDDIREKEGKSVDALFREVFAC